MRHLWRSAARSVFVAISAHPIDGHYHTVIIYDRHNAAANEIDGPRRCAGNRRAGQRRIEFPWRYPVGVHTLDRVPADPWWMAKPSRIAVGHATGQSFTYSRRKPLPQRLTWPTEGDGKCIVQHNVSVSQ